MRLVPEPRVHAVHDFGAGDILEIARPGAKAVMLPFTRDAVPTVDLAAGRIIADPPAGAVDPGGDDGVALASRIACSAAPRKPLIR